MEDLSVSAARDLSGNSLINTLVSKCNGMFGMIERFVGYKAPRTVTSYLYSILVCSNLKHSVLQFFLYEMQALESIQWAHTRYTLNYPDLKHNDRCTIPQNISSQSLYIFKVGSIVILPT